MAKKRLGTGYTFTAAAKTILHADFSDITLAGIQLIVNVTDQIIIYNFADTAKGGTLSTDTLTLEYDTTSMSDSDELMILVEDGIAAQTISGTVTANLSATDNAVLDAIEEDTTHISRLLSGATDSFGHVITGEINNDVDVQFYRSTSGSDLSNIITETEANGGTASQSGGMATFATTTTASSRAKGVSLVPVVYTAGAEVYIIFTAAFPTATGGTGSYRRIGLYNDFTDGFFIGYETTDTFGVTILKGGSATTTLKANFSNDTLVGGASSLFTRSGTPEAIDLTKLNVFRIRFGWVGSAPIEFEVLAPDGAWVTFHTIKQPNLAALPSINTADLYATCDVFTGTSGNAQSILSNCWGAGTTQKLRKLTDTLTNNTLSGLTRSVLTGVTTAGGGAYVNVKVNPSGALTADVTGTVTATATDLDIRNLVAATDIVDLGGNALTSLQLIDNLAVAVDGNYLNTNMNIAGTDVVSGSGTATGALRVELPTNGTGVIATVGAVTAITNALPAGDNNIGNVDIVSGTVTTVSTVTSLTQMNGQVISMGTGVRDAGTQRVTIATNDAVPVTFTGSTDVATQTTLASLLTSSQLIDDTIATLGTTTYTETSTKGSIIGAVRRDANTTLVDTTNEVAPLQVNATGELKVAQIQALPAGTNNIGDVDVLTVPADPFGANADAASATGSISAKLRGIATALGITALDLGTGTGGTRTLRTFRDTAQFVGGTGVDSTAVQRVSLATNVALPAGTNAIGKLAANSGIDIGDVDVTSIAAGTNKIGDVDIAPRTTGGWSVANFNSGDTFTALTNTAQVIKASAGKFGGYYIYNPNSAATYVMLYNTAAASVTVGTTTPYMVFCIPATAGANLELIAGIPFSNAGWSIAAATTGGGNTAPTTALEAMIFYV
jgi:hypothetical protein